MVFIWIIILATLATVLLGSIYFIQVYVDPSEKALMSKAIASLAIFTALCAVMVLPIDVLSLKYRFQSQRAAIELVYYVLYFILGIFAFLLMPFAYFFYEEEDGSNDRIPQAVRALKYTLGVAGAILVMILLVLCVNFRQLQADSPGDRMRDIISVMMSFMLAIGLVGYTSYTAYGLAWIPLAFFRRTPGPVLEDLTLPSTNAELLQIHSQIEFLQAKYISQPQSAWSQKDKLDLTKLRHRESKLALDCDNRHVARPSVPLSCMGSALCKASGFFCGCCSLLIATSLFLSTLDKALHSTCGFSCGFQSDQVFPNPISLVLILSSSYFPLDLVIFSLLMVYLFTATLSGLVQLGVRILCIKLYSIRYHRTKQNAMLMGVWFLLFFLLAINIQTLVLAPQYAVFGNQTLIDSHGNRRPCRITDIGAGCEATILYNVNNILFANVPLIGGFTFVSNALLLLVFCLSSIWVGCVHRPSLPGYIRSLQRSDDLDEYLIT